MLFLGQLDDIDLFTKYVNRDEVSLVKSLGYPALERAGYRITVDKETETFIRIYLDSPIGNKIKVEFAANYLQYEPFIVEGIGPVSNTLDACLSKFSALESRGVVRDYIDAAYILNYLGSEKRWYEFLVLLRNYDSGIFVGSIKFRLNRVFKNSRVDFFEGNPGVDIQLVKSTLVYFNNWLTDALVSELDSINNV